MGPLSRGPSCDLTKEAADPESAQKLSQTRPVVFLHGVGFGLVSHLGALPVLTGDCHRNQQTPLVLAAI